MRMRLVAVHFHLQGPGSAHTRPLPQLSDMPTAPERLINAQRTEESEEGGAIEVSVWLSQLPVLCL